MLLGFAACIGTLVYTFVSYHISKRSLYLFATLVAAVTNLWLGESLHLQEAPFTSLL